MRIGLALALFRAVWASTPTPPAFAEEFSLEYMVTNLQYGFAVAGKWTVDHRNATSTNLRERTDTYNKTLQPRIEVMDFRRGEVWSFSDAPPAHCACAATNGTQPRWALPADAQLASPQPPTQQQRWRVFHVDMSVCVDFFIGLDAATGALAQLPSTLLYFGNCTSGTAVDSENEVLTQNNSYFSFVIAPQADALFQPQHACAGADPCAPPASAWPQQQQQQQQQQHSVTMLMSHFGRPREH